MTHEKLRNPATAAAPLQQPDKLYIDGQWVPASTGKQISVISPDTEALYVQVAEAGKKDIDRAISAARVAFDSGPWPRLSHAARGDFLRAMAEKLRERVAD